MRAKITEGARIIWGSRVGMLSKIYGSMLETRCGGGEATDLITPSPVQRVMILKADGSRPPLGIATIRDRVAQSAVKLVIEPIFEADFCPNSYGFRTKKSAHDAVDEIAGALHRSRAHS